MWTRNNQSILIDIKSIEHQTRSVLITRNSTVLDLKNKIEVIFDVESARQRLIFQAKVLKNEKTIAEYENLNNGKVVHLVIRPIHASRHPENEPRRYSDINRRQLPIGYATITVNTSLSDLINGNNPLLNMLSSIPSVFRDSNILPRDHPIPPTDTESSHSLRPDVDLSFDHIGQGRRSELDGLLDFMDSRSSPISIPLPSNMELRLSRTLTYINEGRALLNTPAHIFEAGQQPSINSRLRNISMFEMRELLIQQPNRSAQVGLVVKELADLSELVVPYLRQLCQTLTQDENSVNLQHQLSEVLKASRIIQVLSLSNHLLGSVLSSLELTHSNTESNSQQQNSRNNKRKREEQDKNHEGSSSSKQRVNN